MADDILPLCPVCLDGEHHDGGCTNCGREASPARPPAGGAEEAASPAAVSSTPMAYLAIHDGECTEICMEEPRSGLIRFIEIAIGCGGYVERVPLEVARQALYRPWPHTAAAPAPDLVEIGGRAIADHIHRDGDFGMRGEDAYTVRKDEFDGMARSAIQAVQEAQWQDISTAPPATSGLLVATWSPPIGSREGIWLVDVDSTDKNGRPFSAPNATRWMKIQFPAPLPTGGL